MVSLCHTLAWPSPTEHGRADASAAERLRLQRDSLESIVDAEKATAARGRISR